MLPAVRPAKAARAPIGLVISASARIDADIPAKTLVMLSILTGVTRVWVSGLVRRGGGAAVLRGLARDVHLHHHAPVTLSDQPITWVASSAVTGLYVEHPSALTPSGSNQTEALQVDERITPITTIKRHRAAGRVRHCPRSLKAAGVEVRFIIKDLGPYP